MSAKQTEPAAGSSRKRMVALAGLALAGALQISAAEVRQTGDDHLRRAAEEAVRTNPFLGVFDHVTVEVEGGRVRLQGSVEQRHRREAAAARVARLSGVLEVRNDIVVQSSSTEDVMLRRRLFERLYYGGAFNGSEQPGWPVRILVSDGRVTFAGAVGSSAVRERLEAIAQSAGARSVENQVRAPARSTQMVTAWD